MSNMDNIIAGILVAIGLLVGFAILSEFGIPVTIGPISVHWED